MADPADVAGDTIEVCHADALRRQIGKSAPELQPAWSEWDGKHCVEPDCGAVIPKARAAANRCRCVECQERLEMGR